MVRILLIVALGLAAGCDGLFGPLDAPDLSADPDGGAPLDASGDAATDASNITDPQFAERWTSNACGGSGCDPDEVCMNGLCSSVLAMDATTNAVCAAYDTRLGPRVMCWGQAPGIFDPYDMNDESAGWGVIGGALSADEEFLDLAVGNGFACVLVSDGPPMIKRLTLRCWGNPLSIEIDSELEDPFWGGEFDLGLGDSLTRPNLSAGGLSVCVQARFNGYDEPSSICVGFDADLGFASGTTTFVAAEDKLLRGDATPLPDPSLVATAERLACRSGTRAAGDPDVRCHGELGELATDAAGGAFLGIGEHEELAAGKNSACVIQNGENGDQVICRGWFDPDAPAPYPDGPIGAFERATERELSNLQVTDASGICVATTDLLEQSVVECIFSDDRSQLLIYENVGEHYAAIPNGLCTVVSTNTSDMTCHNFGIAWPGLKIEPLRPE